MRELIDLKEEVRDGFTVSTKRKRIWNVELNLLLKLDEVCKKNDLRYFLDSGTLLGAVRHHGFIPWDDDLDVVMLREDYDKLIACSNESFGGDYELQIITHDPLYPGIHAKIRYKKSTAIIKSWLFNDLDQGIFLDIFPLDGVPDDADEQKKLFDENAFWGRAIKSYYTYDHILSLNPRIIKMLLERRRTAKSLIKNAAEYQSTFKKFEDNFRRYKTSDCKKIGSLLIGLPDRRYFIFDKKNYEDPAELEFEGYKFPCPSGVHEVLDVLIGKDHMTPKKYPSDHGAVYYDPMRPYGEYLQALRKDFSLARRIQRALMGRLGLPMQSALERELLRL